MMGIRWVVWNHLATPSCLGGGAILKLSLNYSSSISIIARHVFKLTTIDIYLSSISLRQGVSYTGGQ